MDPYEIAVLAEDYETKRQHWETLSAQNMPTDPQERIGQAIAYHLAEAAMLNARARLERAKLAAMK